MTCRFDKVPSAVKLSVFQCHSLMTFSVLSAVRTVSATCGDRFLSAVVMLAVPLCCGTFVVRGAVKLSVSPVGTGIWRATVGFSSDLFRRFCRSRCGPDLLVAACQCCRCGGNPWYRCVCGHLMMGWFSHLVCQLVPGCNLVFRVTSRVECWPPSYTLKRMCCGLLISLGSG
jgi:hypothetical protein